MMSSMEDRFILFAQGSKFLESDCKSSNVRDKIGCGLREFSV